MSAAIEEYAEHGWSGFSLNAVARRAGVGKSTVYSRWADKEALLTDSVKTMTSAIEDVDTGDLRGDLELLAANLLRHFLDPAGWATLRIAVDVAGRPDAPGRFGEVVATAHRVAARAIVARAIERGQASAEIPAEMLIQTLYGSITMQSLTRPYLDQPVPDEAIEEAARPTVDFVLAAVREHLCSV
jgi:AcrR family transcriptional regulator